jgi:hypothetical protein
MARTLSSGSSQYLTSSFTSLWYPFALVCWARPATDTTEGVLVSVATSSDTDYFALWFAGNQPGDPFGTSINIGANFAFTSTGYTINTWHHAAGIWVSSTDHRVLIDAGGKGTDSNTATNSNDINRIRVGVSADSTPFGYASSDIAEAAVYDLSVFPGATDSDKANYFETRVLPALVMGYSPEFYSLGLVSYWDIVGRDSPEPDTVGGFDLALVNTPTAAPHPHKIFPGKRLWIAPPPGEIDTDVIHHFDEIAPVPARGNTTSSFDHWRGGELITVRHGAIPETLSWRGDEQAPVPAQGVTAGGLDFWRGGELLPVFQEAAPETYYWRDEELTSLAPYKVSVGTFDFWQGDELLTVYSEGAPVDDERVMELLFIRQPIPAGIFDI